MDDKPDGIQGIGDGAERSLTDETRGSGPGLRALRERILLTTSRVGAFMVGQRPSRREMRERILRTTANAGAQLTAGVLSRSGCGRRRPKGVQPS